MWRNHLWQVVVCGKFRLSFKITSRSKLRCLIEKKLRAWSRKFYHVAISWWNLATSCSKFRKIAGVFIIGVTICFFLIKNFIFATFLVATFLVTILAQWSCHLKAGLPSYSTSRKLLNFAKSSKITVQQAKFWTFPLYPSLLWNSIFKKAGKKPS